MICQLCGNVTVTAHVVRFNMCVIWASCYFVCMCVCRTVDTTWLVRIVTSAGKATSWIEHWDIVTSAHVRFQQYQTSTYAPYEYVCTVRVRTSYGHVRCMSMYVARVLTSCEYVRRACTYVTRVRTSHVYVCHMCTS